MSQHVPAGVPPQPWQVAVVGAGPVGLALALQAARQWPQAGITVFDARAATHDVSGDPRTLALSLGSVQLLQRLGAWPAAHAAEILQVHVSQQPPSLALPWGSGEAEVLLTAQALGVPLLGAVLRYGQLVQALQTAWLAACAAEPTRLHTRFGTPVSALKDLHDAQGPGVEVDAGIAERFDLVVLAEGGLFGEQADKPVQRDYGQTAWVGSVVLAGATPGRAVERFTRQGPAALLPLPADASGRTQAALVWCVESSDDPVRELSDAQRLAVLNTIFPRSAGRVVAISPLKGLPLGLNAERRLLRGAAAEASAAVQGAAASGLAALAGRAELPWASSSHGRVVRIGNAAQTLHPVAGQGLNLGLRDAHTLVAALRHATDIDSALRRVEWQRAPDRWGTIATTDLLARAFTWQLPGAATVRGLGLAALQAAPPLRRWLARQMMFGLR